jgi:hypothetical protein
MTETPPRQAEIDSRRTRLLTVCQRGHWLREGEGVEDVAWRSTFVEVARLI